MRVGEVIRCPTVEYLLEKELVQQDKGEVCFRARDMITGSRVRLALWPSADDAVIDRGRRRARVLASLEDPAIERLLQFGATVATAAAPAVPFVTTEWVPGESLAERLLRGAVGYETAVRIGAVIARALDRAHAAELVHGSISPASIVLPSEAPDAPSLADAVKLVGFVSASTGAGGYAAPERAGAPADALDPRLDLYSLGAVLYRCVAGRPPFEERERTDTLPMESRRAVPLASLAPLAPDALSKLVDALLSPDRSARPASASEVAARLEALRPGSPRAGSQPPPRSDAAVATMIVRQSSAPPSRVRVSERPRAAVIIVGLAFGALGVAGVVALAAMRSARSDGSLPSAPEPPTSAPVASTSASPSAAPTSTARIMSSVPIPAPSAPEARFACGMSFFCSAEKEYCLVAGDRETTFSCVRAPKCPGRPECDCVTVAHDSCERIDGGLMVRRGVRSNPEKPEEEEED
ncbi:MAG: hypothetical protein U0414_04085 [Polyangiaceae bacterium]